MKIQTIRATSRLSTKIGESFYTFEYCEERQIEENDNIEEERGYLWEVCNTEVDNQLSDVLKLYRK